MKKYILLILLLFFPLLVFARDEYVFDKYYIDASIVSNGDLNVKEMMILNGSFDGYVREITYRNSALIYNDPINFMSDAIYNGLSIENVSIKAKYVNETDNPFDIMNTDGFTPLIKVYYDEDAKNTNYVESSIRDGKNYKMYFKGDKEVVAYYITYTIRNAVVKHQDIAELYWNFIGNKYQDTINDVNIRIHLPQPNSAKTFKMYVHGSDNYIINYLGNDNEKKLSVDEEKDIYGMLFETKGLKPYNPVDIRLTFDVNDLVYTPLNKQSNTLAFEKIVEVEEGRIKEEKEEVEKKEHTDSMLKKITIILIGIILGWWIIVYFKFVKKHKVNYNELINKKIIKDYNVEVVDYLLNGDISLNAFFASIMNLVNKKNIIKELNINSKNKEEYVFKYSNKDNTNETEQILMNFVFNKVGTGDSFSMKDLEKYVNSSKTSELFLKNFNEWKNCAIKDAIKEEFYESNGIPIISSILVLFGAVMVSFAGVFFDSFTFFSLMLLLLGICFMFYCLHIKRMSKKGEEHYKKWMALKRYLESDEFKKERNDKYLPYIILFELDENILNEVERLKK